MTDTFGERVLLARRRRRKTQRELAGAALINTNTISRLEQGVIKNLNGDIVARLADVLGTTTDYLLGRTDEAGAIPENRECLSGR